MLPAWTGFIPKYTFHRGSQRRLSRNGPQYCGPNHFYNNLPCQKSYYSYLETVPFLLSLRPQFYQHERKLERYSTSSKVIRTPIKPQKEKYLSVVWSAPLHKQISSRPHQLTVKMLAIFSYTYPLKSSQSFLG